MPFITARLLTPGARPPISLVFPALSDFPLPLGALTGSFLRLPPAPPLTYPARTSLTGTSGHSSHGGVSVSLSQDGAVCPQVTAVFLRHILQGLPRDSLCASAVSSCPLSTPPRPLSTLHGVLRAFLSPGYIQRQELWSHPSVFPASPLPPRPPCPRVSPRAGHLSPVVVVAAARTLEVAPDCTQLPASSPNPPQGSKRICPLTPGVIKLCMKVVRGGCWPALWRAAGRAGMAGGGVRGASLDRPLA